MLGDTGVGKSSLVLRFVTNSFRPYSESTVRWSLSLSHLSAIPLTFPRITLQYY
ncbi:hypothetical protein EON65_07365 [archaeon]|nr:MAG: hypothetical protein EON65_07365 [archaeon]